ncbi:hypothetical protein CCP3SC1_2200001 [Gammaproteobacteria bacterium]
MVGCAIGYAVVTSASDASASAYTRVEFYNGSTGTVNIALEFYGSILLPQGARLVIPEAYEVTDATEMFVIAGGIDYAVDKTGLAGKYGGLDLIIQTDYSTGGAYAVPYERPTQWDSFQEGFLYALPFIAFALTLIAVRKIARPSVEEL